MEGPGCERAAGGAPQAWAVGQCPRPLRAHCDPAVRLGKANETLIKQMSQTEAACLTPLRESMGLGPCQ